MLPEGELQTLESMETLARLFKKTNDLCMVRKLLETMHSMVDKLRGQESASQAVCQRCLEARISLLGLMDGDTQESIRTLATLYRSTGMIWAATSLEKRMKTTAIASSDCSPIKEVSTCSPMSKSKRKYDMFPPCQYFDYPFHWWLTSACLSRVWLCFRKLMR